MPPVWGLLARNAPKRNSSRVVGNPEAFPRLPFCDSLTLILTEAYIRATGRLSSDLSWVCAFAEKVGRCNEGMDAEPIAIPAYSAHVCSSFRAVIGRIFRCLPGPSAGRSSQV